MNILITGGAGYIGSIITEQLLLHHFNVFIIDSLVSGHNDAVAPGAQLEIGDIADSGLLDTIFRRYEISTVIHTAAHSIVSQSMTNPRQYFSNNVIAGLSLLNSMVNNGVRNIIFSSSAAVYGEARSTPIPETHPLAPLNPYGETKLIFENLLKWYGKAYGIRSISLRYFNAAGASDRYGEDHSPETHLIPIILRTALSGKGTVSLFGNDYPTKDGSCIRDYVHVMDIAAAHIAALSRIEKTDTGIYNLGNTTGYSVREVIRTASEICGKEIPVTISPRREGDPAVLQASSDLIKSDLGWKPEYSKLETIISSAWDWMKRFPDGYDK